MDRNEAITQIRAGLKRRSGKAWSVTGGRGTAWGWLTIDIPARRRTYAWDGVTSAGKPDQYASLAEREELTALLGLGQLVHPQGESVPASGTYWEEYVDRANGRTPSKVGTPYWD